MKFGRVAIAAGEGLILAHSVKGAGVVLRKGEVIGASEIAALESAGITSVIGARLESGDVVENVAALRLAERIAGRHVSLERPFTGRCNLLAEADGLVLVDAAMVDAVNGVDESITLATLAPMQPTAAGEMVATVKIIPFAVGGAFLDAAVAVGRPGAIAVAPFLPLRVGVVSTLLPALKRSVVDKTLGILEDRLAPARARIVFDIRVVHDAIALAEALGTLADVDLVVIFGASAITDRRDVVPVAIEMAGGHVDHLGMPVDPGNLLLLGRLDRGGTAVPVIGAPGCARSPKENGFDFVLWRLLAGLPVRGADLRRMGVGGLLGEIATRPQQRRPIDG